MFCFVCLWFFESESLYMAIGSPATHSVDEVGLCLPMMGFKACTTVPSIR